MSDHYSERQLDALASESAKAHTDDLHETDKHLTECPMCLEKFRYLEHFHRLFLEELTKPIDPRVQELVSKGLPSNVVVLVPYQPHAEEGIVGLNRNITVLAAQDRPQGIEQYVAVATFASKEEKALLRVVQDVKESKERVFLLCEDERLRQGSEIVVVDDEGRVLRLSPDQSGMAQIESARIDWKTARVALVRRET